MCLLTFVKDRKNFLLKPLVCKLEKGLVVFVLIHYNSKANFEKVSANVDELLVKRKLQ